MITFSRERSRGEPSALPHPTDPTELAPPPPPILLAAPCPLPACPLPIPKPGRSPLTSSPPAPRGEPLWASQLKPAAGHSPALWLSLSLFPLSLPEPPPPLLPPLHLAFLFPSVLAFPFLPLKWKRRSTWGRDVQSPMSVPPLCGWVTLDKPPGTPTPGWNAGVVVGPSDFSVCPLCAWVSLETTLPTFPLKASPMGLSGGARGKSFTQKGELFYARKTQFREVKALAQVSRDSENPGSPFFPSSMQVENLPSSNSHSTYAFP